MGMARALWVRVKLPGRFATGPRLLPGDLKCAGRRRRELVPTIADKPSRWSLTLACGALFGPRFARRWTTSTPAALRAARSSRHGPPRTVDACRSTNRKPCRTQGKAPGPACLGRRLAFSRSMDFLRPTVAGTQPPCTCIPGCAGALLQSPMELPVRQFHIAHAESMSSVGTTKVRRAPRTFFGSNL